MKRLDKNGFVKSCLALLLLTFIAADANAFFGRGRGCSTGCSTAGCNTDTSPTAVNDNFTFVPSKKKTESAPASAAKSIAGPMGPQGLQGIAGPQGPAGKDGVITPEQMEQIVQHVTQSLLPQMKTDPSFRGEAGLAGKDGVPGSNGRDGKDAEPIDINAVAAAVAQKLPPVTLNFMDKNGQVAHTQTAKLGEAFNLPPVVLNSRNADGTLATVTKPIGDALTVTFNKSE